MNWFVLYTKPRWEKKVTNLLHEQGIEVYCPMVTEVRQWSDRKKKITAPLFKSYVFVRLPENRRNEVFDVPGVVRYLFWLGKPAVVRQEEVETIEAWLKDKKIKMVEVGHLMPGDKMTIASGKLKGKEAEVSEVGRKRLRLVLREMGVVVNVRISEALEN